MILRWSHSYWACLLLFSYLAQAELVNNFIYFLTLCVQFYLFSNRPVTPYLNLPKKRKRRSLHAFNFMRFKKHVVTAVCQCLVFLIIPLPLLFPCAITIAALFLPTKERSEMHPTQLLLKAPRVQLVHIGTGLLALRIFIRLFCCVLRAVAVALEKLCQWIPLTRIGACYLMAIGHLCFMHGLNLLFPLFCLKKYFKVLSRLIIF